MSIVFITELINLTGMRIEFEFVDDGTRDPTSYIQIPSVRPNKTNELMFGYIMISYTFKHIDWEVRVLMDGESTGNKIIAYLFLYCVLIFFIEYNEGDRVRLLVLGAPFKGNIDSLHRMRGIGLVWEEKKMK